MNSAQFNESPSKKLRRRHCFYGEFSLHFPDKNKEIMKVILPFALLLTLLQSCDQKPKPADQQPKTIQKAKTSEVPKFDGAQAFEYLKAQTDFGPRAPGTNAHAQCLVYLQNTMREFAEAVNVQEFTHIGYDKKPIRMANIISSFNLKASSRVLFVAHWDSRPRADQDSDQKKKDQPILGANDGASGVAVLIEIARHLKENPLTVGVDMIFVDGEDYGKEGDNQNYLLGSRYFTKNLPPGFSPMFGIVIDMIGDAQLTIKKERYSLKYAPDVVERVWSTAAALNIEQFSPMVQGWVTDDHLPFNEVGIKTIDLIDFEYPDESNVYWHSTQDTPDKCSPESLEAVGMVLMHVIYNLQPQ
jgi:glutaminyl-peptide cyclotransferase